MIETINASIFNEIKEKFKTKGCTLTIKGSSVNGNYIYIAIVDMSGNNMLCCNIMGWPSQCAMMIMYELKSSSLFYKDKTLVELFGEAVDTLAHRYLGYHQVVHTTSDEERGYAKQMLETAGFEEMVDSSFISVRTYHKIRFFVKVGATPLRVKNAVKSWEGTNSVYGG